MEQCCPHCDTPLPEDATFCPHCAQNTHKRKRVFRRIPLRRKLTLGLLVLVLLAAAGVGIWWLNRPYVPQTYDSGDTGEVLYTIDGVDYQLLVAWPDDRTLPAPYIMQSGLADDVTRWPSRLYVNYQKDGSNGWTAFEPYVDTVTVEVEQDPAGKSELTAGEPAHRADYSPDAALLSSLDFTGDCGSPQVVWTITMRNGDVIRIHQTIAVTLIPTRVYHWRDYPMDTIAQLQALVDEIDQTVDWRDEVILYLPPVTYEGKLFLNSHSFTFYGCTDGTGRTVFTDTVSVNTLNGYWLNFFYDIDFVGDGTGVGLSFEQNGRATNCTFTGWDTAVKGNGSAWVNVIECTVTHNKVGFHFNSEGQSANHSLYNDNLFQNNGTAVLLERVPTDITLNFQGTTFEGNGTDVDNRCNHPVDLAQAVFK